MAERKFNRNNQGSMDDTRLGRFIAGIIDILKTDPKSAMRCYGSSSVVIRGGSVTYSAEEALQIKNEESPRNDPNLS